MMSIGIYGTKGSAIGEFTDKAGRKVKFVFDKFEYKNESEILYPPELEGAYGHGATIIRYLRYFENYLKEDITPVPDAVEGAKSIAVCSAVWESKKSGKPMKVFNEF